MILTSQRVGGTMGLEVSSGQVFRFGQFEADVARHTLTRNGVRVRIQDQPFRVLLLLLESPGKIVTREELRKTLWPEDTYIDFDGSVNVILKKLRAAIDDDSENPRFVETVPRRGYRFIAPVSIEQSDPGETPKPPDVKPTASNLEAPVPAQRAKPWKALALVFLALLLAGSGWWYFRRNQPAVQAARKAIAVLPFSNEGAGADFDYLRYAIASDLVTDLTYAHSVTVRPFASTVKYGAQPIDPAAAGKELGVTHVLTGEFLRDQQNLRLTMELVDVEQNRAIWRDELTVGPQELVALHDKLAVSTSQRLLPAMKLSNTTSDRIPKPNNEEAFDLFLHSLAYPLDPGPNQMAIKVLQDSVALDSKYAPAWDQLSWRYYIDERYGNGGAVAAAKGAEAYRRQRELDPNAPPISTTLRTEQGDLNGAYDQAAEFLRREPDSAMAHFWMGYVLRYAGLIDEAGKECDAALAIDPGFNVLRSCATTFGMKGDYAHAQKYIKVDDGTGFAALSRMEIALRMRDTATALSEANKTVQLGYRNVNAELARVYLSHPSAAELAKAVADVETDPISSRDPELLYRNAEVLAFCEQNDAALRELKRAIQGKYCSYPAMDRDPLFAAIRERPEFAELRSAGSACQQNFQSHRKEFDATLRAAATPPN